MRLIKADVLKPFLLRSPYLKKKIVEPYLKKKIVEPQEMFSLKKLCLCNMRHNYTQYLCESLNIKVYTLIKDLPSFCGQYPLPEEYSLLHPNELPVGISLKIVPKSNKRSLFTY